MWKTHQMKNIFFYTTQMQYECGWLRVYVPKTSKLIFCHTDRRKSYDQRALDDEERLKTCRRLKDLTEERDACLEDTMYEATTRVHTYVRLSEVCQLKQRYRSQVYLLWYEKHMKDIFFTNQMQHVSCAFIYQKSQNLCQTVRGW